MVLKSEFVKNYIVDMIVKTKKTKSAKWRRFKGHSGNRIIVCYLLQTRNTCRETKWSTIVNTVEYFILLDSDLGKKNFFLISLTTGGTRSFKTVIKPPSNPINVVTMYKIPFLAV